MRTYTTYIDIRKANDFLNDLTTAMRTEILFYGAKCSVDHYGKATVKIRKGAGQKAIVESVFNRYSILN